jgi:osmotically-inducible protein OsmY
VILALVIGLVVGAAAVWYLGSNEGKAQLQHAGTQAQDAAKSAGQAIQDKLKVLDLRTNDIRDELTETGRIIRRRAKEVAQVVADSTADARTTAAIKAKLFASHELSSLSISVNTTNGIVTLSGTVPTLEDISKAMLLALETDGVKEVISTLQVKSKG